jgi:O-antigen/teichoic acid export membrane protein
VRECAQLPLEAQRTLVGKLLTLQLLTFGVVGAGLVAFLLISHPSTDTLQVVLILTVYQIAYIIGRTLFVPALARQAMDLPAKLEGICRAGGIVVGVVLIQFVHAPLAVALAPLAAGNLVLLVLAGRTATRFLGGLRLTTDRRDWVRIGRVTWPFASMIVISQLNSRVDIIALSLTRGEDAVGLYASASKLLETGVVPLFFLGLAAYPSLSRLTVNRDQTLTDTAVQFFGQCLLAGAVLMWSLYYLAPLVVLPLLGSRFSVAIPFVQMLAPLGLLTALEVIGMRVLLASQMHMRRLVLWSSGALLRVALVVALVPWLGIPGAVIAAIASMTLVVTLYLIFLRGHPLQPALVGAVARLAPGCVCAIAAGALISLWTSDAWIPAGASLAILLMLSAMTGLIPGLRLWRR